jgi:GNAT superfamily N-acetyltransferase
MNLFIADEHADGFTVHAFEGDLLPPTAWVHTNPGYRGFLIVESLTVVEVFTSEPYRRQGIATAMLRHAEAHAGAPISHSVDRNAMSDAWSHTTGSPRPESRREMAIRLLAMDPQEASIFA